MLNSSILLLSEKNTTRWEGIVYPNIFRSPIYDSLGNPTGRYKWVCNYGNYPNGTSTGIYLLNIELRSFFMDTTNDDASVEFIFAATMPNSILYIKRTDKNILIAASRRGSSAFQANKYNSFFSSSDKGKGIPIILSSNPL